jgi:hypothetical protein
MLAAVEGELRARAGDAHAHLTAWSVPSVRCKELDGQDAGSWIGVGAFDVGQTQGPLRALLPRARPAAQGGRPADDRLTLSIPPYATTAVRRLPTLPLPLSSMARWKKAAGEPARPEVGDRGCAMPSALTVFMALTGTWHPGWRAQRSRHFKRSSWRPYCKARPSIGWVIHDYDTWPLQRSPAGLRRGGRDRLLRVDRRLLRGRRRGLVTTDPSGGTLYHRVEGGEISQSTFERELARLRGVAADGRVVGLWPALVRSADDRAPGPARLASRRCRLQLLGDRPY